MNNFNFLFLFFIVVGFSSCKDEASSNSSKDYFNNVNHIGLQNSFPDFFLGADLSYVNEMEDCGAVYFNTNNIQKDVYKIFANSGANIARFRLWHNPSWTNYSNLSDVKKSIKRAKENDFFVLLDFHFSDTWADPGKQLIPSAWLPIVDNTSALASKLYDYTTEVLYELNDEGLNPDIVQLGNEINTMILQEGELEWPINWTRNSILINSAINAVRDFSRISGNKVETMLHIAQPENGLWWFDEASKAGINDFDWIGLSYYPQWSEYNLSNIRQPLETLINSYNKKLMIVETAYPFTLDYADSQNNIIGSSGILEGYPATQQGQLNFLLELTSELKRSGGLGLIYWEPAWVSTSCNSAWENVTLFDFDGLPTLGMQFLNQ